MRLSDYILERVMTRSVPEVVSSQSPSVLMKLDIEGSELEVLTDMIVSGALQVGIQMTDVHTEDRRDEG